MKMANIDAVFDFMFTNPKRKDGVRFTSVTVSLAVWYALGCIVYRGALKYEAEFPKTYRPDVKLNSCP